MEYAPKLTASGDVAAELALAAVRYAEEEGPSQPDRAYLELVAEYIERHSQAESAEHAMTLHFRNGIYAPEWHIDPATLKGAKFYTAAQPAAAPESGPEAWLAMKAGDVLALDLDETLVRDIARECDGSVYHLTATAPKGYTLVPEELGDNKNLRHALFPLGTREGQDAHWRDVLKAATSKETTQ